MAKKPILSNPAYEKLLDDCADEIVDATGILHLDAVHVVIKIFKHVKKFGDENGWLRLHS